MLLKQIYLPLFSTCFPFYELTPLQQPLLEINHLEFEKIAGMNTKFNLVLILVTLSCKLSIRQLYKMGFAFPYCYQTSCLIQTTLGNGLMNLYQFRLYTKKLLDSLIKAISVMIYLIIAL